MPLSFVPTSAAPTLSADGRSICVRAFKRVDAPALTRLYARSVRELGARHYSEAQTAAWAALAPAPSVLIERYASGRLALVAEELGSLVVAFGDVDPTGHIGYFYCSPEHAGTGTAGHLYECLEASARAARVRKLHVEASETARGFFERRGFRWMDRQELRIGETGIHNHRMEKAI